jgi:peptidoglycan/LPS O-acetylase OafA/YrhL
MKRFVIGVIAILSLVSLSKVHVTAELNQCVRALSTLNDGFRSRMSFPFLNAVSGHMNLAYMLQKPLQSLIPNRVMGDFSMCNNADFYSFTEIETTYCTLGVTSGGVCVPAACTAQDLMNPALIPPLRVMTASAFEDIDLETCGVDPFLTPRCAMMKVAYDYYNSLMTQLMVFELSPHPDWANEIHCGPRSLPANAGSYVMWTLICLFTFLMLLGLSWSYIYHNEDFQTIFSLFFEKKGHAIGTKKEGKEEEDNSNNNNKSAVKTMNKANDEMKEESQNDHTSTILLETKTAGTNGFPSKIQNEKDVTTSVANESKIQAPSGILACFDLSANWNEIFDLHTRPGEFACFDALRVLSATWVIFYHVLLWQLWNVQNMAILFPPDGILAQWWTAPFFNFSGTLSVDTFFFVSAFLATYLLLKKLDKEESQGKYTPGYKLIPYLWFHRFLRITPVYMFCLGFHMFIAPLFAYGPFAESIWSLNVEPCQKEWWKNLLYINNFWGEKQGETCYGHSWYLADDMQFYFLTPFFVLLYRNFGKIGKYLSIAAVLAVSIACFSYSWYITNKDNWSPILWDYAEFTSYTSEGYQKPWNRWGPYMIGILFAFIWYEKKMNYPDFKFSDTSVLLLASLSALLLALACYGPLTGTIGKSICIYGEENTDCGSGYSEATKAAIIVLCRPTWALGVAIMCVLCFNNQGGFVQRLLTLSLWKPLAALSFTVYLVHYTVLTFYISDTSTRIHISFFDWVNIFFGISVISAILALVAVLLVEKPFMKLQKMYIP